MSLMQKLIEGNEGGLKHETMTPMQKIALRFVVIGLLYYGLAALEGMIMRMHEIKPIPLIDESHFFSIMTVHPMVGIFGSSYMIVFGAFLFLVPFLMKKPIYSIKLANISWISVAGGTFIMWLAGFLFSYAPLYTLYWPLPVDMKQFTTIGGIVYIVGVVGIMIGTFLFTYNIFKTILYTPEGWEKQPAGALLRSALGLEGLLNFFRREKKEHLVPLPIAAISRGTIDMGLNALVISSAGVLILIYLLGSLFGIDLKDTWVDALLYKNIFWWGLDLVADGLVLIFVAGTWYLLAMLITGTKELFMQNIARAALFVEMVVSWTVWSHHLMSDQCQSNTLKVLSGEVVTAFELVTQGIAVFIVLVTLYRARPLKMTNELKFLLGGILGFMLAVPAGIIQADLGMNRILHNTQWVIGNHVHVAILVGLTMTLYSAIYVLFPILTNGVKLYSQKLANIHFWLHLIGGIGMGAFMGMAGIDGMLRRSIYYNGEYSTYMILAGICGAMMLLAFVIFMYNIIMSVGIKGLIGIYKPATIDTRECLKPEKE
ncbi:cbb3-type cytochrome c oxidase subunit I [Hydrogenimonas thermophila]|uniref:cbb3-type cytochrome c oxidase subunit I n=1 Tax=Hydrogenimonas thermophila TaxID=223786 RepID=UPI0029371912|nr:cbb3-type cytochrome c oxidase subunit I [Hydrogenimonas thermophila]WOE70716.1 cbb3-type cytochrome c oxidase subunit I [Hydrogenimonas thermophila]WOE73234.1 cbb3-type cytochrome c oxidase subunit I [Hydrogenimonas thermophila]